ncbi:MAG: hypothetical protein QOI76_3914 [Frankiales bacterium]|nr:hypothetical protein [Frankiales bacterium]
MPGTPWLRWSLAALMAAIAAYHLVRLVAARRRARHGEVDVDVTHAAMGSAMAMMLLGGLTLRSSQVWATAFCAPAVWFGLRTLLAYVRGGARAVAHPVQQAVLSAAMLCMLLAAATPARAGTGSTVMRGMAMSGSGAGGAGSRGLLVVAGAVVAVALATAAGLGRQGRSGDPRSGTLAPRTTAACQLAMTATTAYMLLLLA